MKIFTVSIAGFGLVGQRRYSFIKKFKNLNVVSISDNYSPYRNRFNNGEVFKDYSEMFKNIKTDIVFVCLPNKYATDATLKALKNGSHVFVKNPQLEISKK